MKKLQISKEFLKNLETLKGAHKFIDDVIKVPGMNYFMSLLSWLQKGAEGLDFAVLQQIEKFLILEFLKSGGKIKSVLANFLRVKFKRDEEFKKRSVETLASSFKDFCGQIITQGSTDGSEIVEDTINNIEKIRTISMTLDIISVEKQLFTQELITLMFELNLKITTGFCSVLKSRNFVTFKQIELMIENLKVFNYCLGKELYESKVKNAGEAVHQKISEIVEKLNLLFPDAPKLNRDLLFHTSFLVYHYHLLKGESDFRKKFFSEGHELQGDAVHVTNIAKSRAYINYGDDYYLGEPLVPDFETDQKSPKKLPLLEMLVKYAHYSQINVKQNAFRVINEFLRRIAKEQKLKEKLREHQNLKEGVFEIIVQSWEFPIRGFANFMEEVFSNFVKCLNQDEIKGLIDKIQAICTAPTRRRFASSRIILEHVTIDEFLAKNKNIVKELLLFEQKANDNSVVMLLRALLSKKFKEVTKGIKREKKKVNNNLKKFREKYQSWVDFWIEDYISVLKIGSERLINELVEYIHPPIFDICSEALVLVINRLDREDLTLDNLLAAKVGLIRLARSNGLLYINKERTDYCMDCLERETHWNGMLGEMVSHSNRHISLDAIRAVTEPRKVSEEPLEWEYRIFERIFMYNFKNSYPDFRNDLAVIINKLFQRLRGVMNREFKAMKSEEDFKNFVSGNKKFENFVNFMVGFKRLFIANVYPDSPFESSYPYLKTINSIFEIFSSQAYVFRNKNVFDGTRILYYLDFYNQDIFDILVSSFKCQWDTVRKMSFSILKRFPADLSYLDQDFKTKRLLEPSKLLMSSPVIRDVEASTYSFGLYYQLEQDIGAKMSMIEEMVELLRTRKSTMEASFLSGKAEFAQSLYHGILTTLGIIACDEATFVEFFSFDQNRLSKIYKKIIAQIVEIINFSKTVISKSSQTFILDNEDTRNQILKLRKNDYKKIIDKLDSANTLLDAHTQDQNEMEINTDNISVVAFYLVSKESGALFGKIAQLISFTESKAQYAGLFEEADIISLVQNCTESLLSIKHLGAIDNIANGLTTICRCLYDTSRPAYIDLIKSMMTKILTSLKNNEFKSIFRRSAGLPSAIIALMKAEPYRRRVKLMPFCMDSLLEMAADETLSELSRIHALNILKYCFQDAQLKLDLEHYIGEGLKLAIIGFTDNDWSIRNSSLMVYSAIISRMFVKSNENKVSNKNKLNIIQFFLRAPNLIKFFTEEIQKFSNSTEFNQYPSLYPICLIFSKLLPYDMKDDSLADNSNINKLDDVQKTQSRVILPSEIKTFKTLLLGCTGHQNYLGRVLVARAIVPFIPINRLDEVIDDLVSGDRKVIIKDHNKAQGALLISKFVLRNFMGLCKHSNYSLELDKPTSETYGNIVRLLAAKQKAYIGLKCTPVFLNYLEVVIELARNSSQESGFEFDYGLFGGEGLIERAERLVKAVFDGGALRAVFDVCESELVDRVVRFLVEFYRRVGDGRLGGLLDLSDLVLEGKLGMLNEDDTNPFVSLYDAVNEDLTGDEFKALINPERLKRYLTVSQQIMKEFQKASHLVGPLIKFISRALELSQNSDLEVAFLSEEFYKTLNLAFSEDFKENMNIIQELLPVSALFAFKLDGQKRHDFLTLLSKMIQHYSNADQKDNLRYACVEALKSLTPHSATIQEDSTAIYISLMQSLITLITDEYAEIRLEASKLVKSTDSGLTSNDNMAVRVVFKQIFKGLKQRESDLSEQDRQLVKEFVLGCVCSARYEKYKYMALYNSRIFNYDKPNKYREDLKIINSLLGALEETGFEVGVSRADWEDYLERNEVKLAKDLETEIKAYFENVFARNEFIFGKAIQGLAVERLVGGDGEGGTTQVVRRDYFEQFIVN